MSSNSKHSVNFIFQNPHNNWTAGRITALCRVLGVFYFRFAGETSLPRVWPARGSIIIINSAIPKQERLLAGYRATKWYFSTKCYNLFSYNLFIAFELKRRIPSISYLFLLSFSREHCNNQLCSSSSQIHLFDQQCCWKSHLNLVPAIYIIRHPILWEVNKWSSRLSHITTM